jgi:hypothetical protein
VPELDRPDMRFVVAAEQHHDGLQEFACKHRHRDSTGKAGRERLIGPLEIGVGEFGEDHGVARRPGLARKSLVISEVQLFADGFERGQPLAVEAATKFQPHARPVGHPEFNDAKEGFHRAGPPSQALTASVIWLRSGRAKFRQGGSNFVRRRGAQRLGPSAWISRDASHTISPAAAGDGNSILTSELVAGGRLSQPIGRCVTVGCRSAMICALCSRSVTGWVTGSCSTVARWPSTSCVTSTYLPSGNSIAS